MTCLDIRVGEMSNVRAHTDKLYAEDIDVGEGEGAARPPPFAP